ncbi:MAG: SH3 domain-containing protein, partial [Clostridia bacterium]
MKANMKRTLSIAMVVILVLGMTSTALAGRIYSKPFKLPKIKNPARSAAITEIVQEGESGGGTQFVAAEKEKVGIANPQSAKLNVRKKASKKAKLVCTIKKGKTFTVLGEEGKWTKIKYGKKTGFVQSKYVKYEQASALAAKGIEETIDPNAPVVPVEPEATVDPNAPVMPEATIDPNAPVVPEATIDPNAPVVPEATIDPNAPIVPEATIDPNAPVVPEATIDPNAPVVPEATIDPNAP